jgi:hypothetical protein
MTASMIIIIILTGGGSAAIVSLLLPFVNKLLGREHDAAAVAKTKAEGAEVIASSAIALLAPLETRLNRAEAQRDELLKWMRKQRQANRDHTTAEAQLLIAFRNLIVECESSHIIEPGSILVPELPSLEVPYNGEL